MKQNRAFWLVGSGVVLGVAALVGAFYAGPALLAKMIIEVRRNERAHAAGLPGLPGGTHRSEHRSRAPTRGSSPRDAAGIEQKHAGARFDFDSAKISARRLPPSTSAGPGGARRGPDARYGRFGQAA